MIKVVLVDDEKLATETLQLQLKKLRKDIEIVAVFNDSQKALAEIPNLDFQLLFLDIEMPRLSGFELLIKLMPLNFDVIFVTAYNQYAIEAFKYNAISYCLKPVEDTELLQAINTWEQKQQQTMGKDQFENFFTAYQVANATAQKVALPTTDGYQFIPVQNIVRCQSQDNYTHFILNTKENLLICRTLKEVEKILGRRGFLRIHQSHLINPAYLKKYSRSEGGFVIMDNNDELPVSPQRKDAVVQLFEMIQRD
jgi:two-component system LytT family response regulator